jgi:hypothetical protein
MPMKIDIKKEIESKALFRLEEYGRGFRAQQNTQLKIRFLQKNQ